MSVVVAADEVEAIIARTALKYDLLPYQSKAFAQSQPSRLGGIARVFGLDAAPLAGARVLELGCASGGNIIPLAMRYPGASFIGVDLARTQVAAGRARIARLGLANIEIRCQSFTEIGDELGSFDYIICHGVYSWVPPAVQDAIFRIIGARLSPVGIACISYNVLPGWRMLQPLRDAFMLQIPDDVNSLARVAKARELLTFLSESTPDKGPYGDMLRRWAARLSGLPDDYIAHEFLEEMNNPSTVRAFAAGAAGHGLGFLGEVELAAMIPDNYGAEIAQQVRARSANHLVETEQYFDLLSGRTFRHSILVSTARLATADRALSPDGIADLHFVTQAGMRLERDGEKYVIIDASGRTLTTTSSTTADALAHLVSRFPSSSSLADCLDAGADAAERAALLDALYRMLLVGMVTLSSEPVSVGAVSDHPTGIALARADAAEGVHVTNLRHETITLDPAMRALLPMLDGQHDHATLARRLAEEAMAGRLAFQRDGRAITDPEEIAAVTQEHLPALLASMAQSALLDSE
jgi:methyltransferase-like protein/SAM-dependent methyltransferase